MTIVSTKPTMRYIELQKEPMLLLKARYKEALKLDICYPNQTLSLASGVGQVLTPEFGAE